MTDKRTRATVSATVITFNEEEDLDQCLKSLEWCDEIILVDSGSEDRTLEIAAKYGARILVRPFEGFSDQKNFAADHATHEWILSVDADEVVSVELHEEIRRILASTEGIDGYFVPRLNIWLGNPIRHGGWYPDYTLRLYRKDRGRWEGHSHEQVVVKGRTDLLRNNLIHKTISGIHEHLRKGLLSGVLELKEAKAKGLQLRWFYPVPVIRQCLKDWWLGPKSMFSLRMIYKNRIKNRVEVVWLIPLHPFLRFFHMYVVRGGFLDGAAGFWLAYVSGIVEAMKWTRIWEHFVHQQGRSSAREEALEDTTKLYRSIS